MVFKRGKVKDKDREIQKKRKRERGGDAFYELPWNVKMGSERPLEGIQKRIIVFHGLTVLSMLMYVFYVYMYVCYLWLKQVGELRSRRKSLYLDRLVVSNGSRVKGTVDKKWPRCMYLLLDL